MKLLIVRFSSIGDIVLTTPVVRCLKQQLPGCEIHYALKKEFAPILDGNPYIHKLHLLDKNLPALVSELKKENFDHVIDLHANLRTLRMRWGLGGRWSRFQKLNVEKWLLVNLKLNRMPRVHIVQRYMQAVAHLGVKYDGKGLDFFIRPEDEAQALAQLPIGLTGNYVCLVPGAKFATKSIPVDKAVDIIQRIPRPVLILGGPAEAEAAERIIQQAGRMDVMHFCGKLKLPQSAALLKHAHSVITADTGLMHIASAFDKKMVSVWGNTVPEFGMYPFLPDASTHTPYLAEVKNLPCRPCSKIGYAKCPQGHFKCMVEQNAATIATASE